MGGGAEGWYWYKGAVGMVCEVELDGDIEAISVLGNIMRIKVKGINNMQKVSLGGGGAMRGVVGILVLLPLTTGITSSSLIYQNPKPILVVGSLKGSVMSFEEGDCFQS